MYFKLAMGNVRKSLRDYTIYFITLVFGVCVFYAFNSITQQSTVLQLSQQQSAILKLLSGLIGGVSVFIAVVLGFLIVYASRFLIRRRKKEFGIYLTLGMDREKVSRIIIYETLVVGLISLGVGLAAGLLLSQALLYVTAALFAAKMSVFVFIFSFDSLVKTVLCFGVMFAVALVFNMCSVARYQLIDLIHAERTSESIRLRSLPLSVVLFLVSLVMIGVAYRLLLIYGLGSISPGFLASTALVCLGTFLFFYSLSGFLLRVIQLNKRLYLKDLNMFAFRQLNSKINTASISISIVCLALFLALTSTCGGFAINSVFADNLERTTPFDATYSFYYNDEDVVAPAAMIEAARADDYDMGTAFERDVPEYGTLIEKGVQVDFMDSDVTIASMLGSTDYQLDESIQYESYLESTIPMVSLTQFNAARELQGLEPIAMADDQYLIWCDFESLYGFYNAYMDQNDTLTIAGARLRPVQTTVDTTATHTSPLSFNTGVVVLPDGAIPADVPVVRSIYNVMYNGDRSDIQPKWQAALAAAYPENEYFDEAPGWPYMNGITAEEVYEQSASLTAAISYLAIYIGFVLLITCAAILALQQLSEAADNVTRYVLLEKLGADRSMTSKALLQQIAVYFIFPLVLALCHSLVALSEVTETVSIYGHIEIGKPLIITVAMALVVYGGYFVLTYSASRNMIRFRPADR